MIINNNPIKIIVFKEKMEDDDLYDGYNDFNSAFNTDVNKTITT